MEYSMGISVLIQGIWRKMEAHEFSGILREGGAILGASHQPFKNSRGAAIIAAPR